MNSVTDYKYFKNSDILTTKYFTVARKRIQLRYRTDKTGNIHGKVIRYYSNGQVEFTKRFNHGEPVGTITEYNDDGTRHLTCINNKSSKNVYTFYEKNRRCLIYSNSKQKILWYNPKEMVRVLDIIKRWAPINLSQLDICEMLDDCNRRKKA